MCILVCVLLMNDRLEAGAASLCLRSMGHMSETVTPGWSRLPTLRGDARPEDACGIDCHALTRVHEVGSPCVRCRCARSAHSGAPIRTSRLLARSLAVLLNGRVPVGPLTVCGACPCVLGWVTRTNVVVVAGGRPFVARTPDSQCGVQSTPGEAA